MKSALLSSGDLTPEEIAEIEAAIGGPIICVGDLDLTDPATMGALNAIEEINHSWLQGVCLECSEKYPGDWPLDSVQGLEPGWAVYEDDSAEGSENAVRWLLCPDCDDEDEEDDEDGRDEESLS